MNTKTNAHPIPKTPLAVAPVPGQVDFVTPIEEYGSPTGPTKVISRATRPFISNRVMFVGIVGDSNKVVNTVSADVPNAVTIEDAGVVGSGIHWFRLSRPRGHKVAIQAKDAKGTVVTSFSLDIIELPRATGPMDFDVEPADPKLPNRINLRVYAPRDDADYIDTRMIGVGYTIFYLNGFQVHCAGMSMPIEVPGSLVDLNPIKAEPIDAKVYDTLAQANEAIRRAPAKAKGVMPFAYYRGAGGAVIAPTIFSSATTPRIIATLWEARRLYADYVQYGVATLAIALLGGKVVRALLGRFARVSPEEPEPPRALTTRRPFSPPPIPTRIRPVNDTVNVGGTGEIKDVSNLNPVKPGSGGATSGIPNHVKGSMEEMDALFEPGSVKNMYSQRVRYGDVDWQRGTQAAANVMPSGAKVQMNIWTWDQQQVTALKAAFQRAGFKNVRVWGVRGTEIVEDLPGPGTMLEAVR
jgi:hypothetical protein